VCTPSFVCIPLSLSFVVCAKALPFATVRAFPQYAQRLLRGATHSGVAMPAQSVIALQVRRRLCLPAPPFDGGRGRTHPRLAYPKERWRKGGEWCCAPQHGRMKIQIMFTSVRHCENPQSTICSLFCLTSHLSRLCVFDPQDETTLTIATCLLSSFFCNFHTLKCSLHYRLFSPQHGRH
jgi:hypothetical protein